MSAFSFSVISESERRLPFFLVGAGCDFDQYLDPHTRPVGYPYYQWIQCYEGEGILRVNGAEETVPPDYAMFLHPKVPHEYFAKISPWRVHWLTFAGSGVPEVLELLGLQTSGVYGVGNGEILTDRMRYGLKRLISKDPLHGIECSALVYDFLIDLMKYAHPRDDEPVEQKYERLRPAFDYISEHYDRVVQVQDLAQRVGVTPQHFCRLFKSATGRRPFEYLNSYRIARSKDLMIQKPDLTLFEVGRACGYESLNYFSNVFRRFEGMTATNYRKLHGVSARR
ncbi:MAG: helix-turn-helix domain-containing protein [Spirochaetota bacterium]